MGFVYKVFLVITIGAFCHQMSFGELESTHAIQIVSSTNNHTFESKLSEFKRILNVDDIKDRRVVVVSIAGGFRQGKSFLLNFFVKYLEAQVNNSN